MLNVDLKIFHKEFQGETDSISIFIETENEEETLQISFEMPEGHYLKDENSFSIHSGKKVNMNRKEY